MPGMLQVQPMHHMNGSMLIVILIMVSYGLVMLFSASMSDGYANYDGNSMYYVLRQSSVTAVGLALALFIAIGFKTAFFDRLIFSVLLYALTSVLLIYVLINGEVVNNARRWIRLGSTNVQPSELAKVAAVFCLAGYFSWRRRRKLSGRSSRKGAVGQWLSDGWMDILVPAILMLAWLVPILWQPHLSGFIILCFIILMVFLAAGLPLRSWLSGLTQAILVIVILALVASAVLPSFLRSRGVEVEDLGSLVEQNFAHVERRLDMFMNPEEASADDAYQINQAIIAIGSGGITGVGLGRGRQKYNYLPEAHNDYVFAIIGEELGFVGTISVLLLFVLFLILGVGISTRAGSNHAAMLAAGYTALISIQALLNIGVATRTLPATGISLPFFSYGGTSNLFFLLAIGFLLGVSRTGQKERPGTAVALTRSSDMDPTNQRTGAYGRSPGSNSDGKRSTGSSDRKSSTGASGRKPDEMTGSRQRSNERFNARS